MTDDELVIHLRLHEGPPREAVCGAMGQIAMVGLHLRAADYTNYVPHMVNCQGCLDFMKQHTPSKPD